MNPRRWCLVTYFDFQFLRVKRSVLRESFSTTVADSL